MNNKELWLRKMADMEELHAAVGGGARQEDGCPICGGTQYSFVCDECEEEGKRK